MTVHRCLPSRVPRSPHYMELAGLNPTRFKHFVWWKSDKSYSTFELNLLGYSFWLASASRYQLVHISFIATGCSNQRQGTGPTRSMDPGLVGVVGVILGSPREPWHHCHHLPRAPHGLVQRLARTSTCTSVPGRVPRCQTGRSSNRLLNSGRPAAVKPALQPKEGAAAGQLKVSCRSCWWGTW